MLLAAGVRARVLAVDLEAQRLSLGLKATYREGADDEGDDAEEAQDLVDLDAEAAEAVGAHPMDCVSASVLRVASLRSMCVHCFVGR